MIILFFKLDMPCIKMFLINPSIHISMQIHHTTLHIGMLTFKEGQNTGGYDKMHSSFIWKKHQCVYNVLAIHYAIGTMDALITFVLHRY